MILPLLKRFCLIAAVGCAVLVNAAPANSSASPFDAYNNVTSTGSKVKKNAQNASFMGGAKIKLSDLKQIDADNWSVTGNNIIVRGNVHIPFGDLDIFADKAVINIESKDVEAVGNIQLYYWRSETGKVDPDKLARLQQMNNMLVTITGIQTDIWGNQLIEVSVRGTGDNVKAHRITGNMETGFFQMEKAQIQFKTFVCKADFAERRSNGVFHVKGAEVSGCEYLSEHNAHYSLEFGEATFYPPTVDFYGLDQFSSDIGDHSIVAANGKLKIYGVPVVWLPVFYKPKEENIGLAAFKFGKNSDWGYYLMFSKNFRLYDYPLAEVNLMFDYYSKRGIGYGMNANIVSENSKTYLFAYSIYDRNPNEAENYDAYFLNVPNERYSFTLTNVTHITPRLDFRGELNVLSDYYFNNDFFTSTFDSNPQPATYAALEQEFDHFSASVYVRPKVNSFYTTVERLPEIRLDIPRQELFGSNVYYQGDFSMGYLKTDWIDFDRSFNSKLYPNYQPGHYTPQEIKAAQLDNYEAFRVDTTHFLYYPLKFFDWLNIIPRAGFKLTGYSNSTRSPVSDNDLMLLYAAADPQKTKIFPVKNYDDDGGARGRFAGEIGAEANTKIYSSWQNVKSSFLRIDGLRHVMTPYLNYTLIPNPTVDRKYLYAFDDIDRIQEENFVRVGVNNRLETRDGDKIREYFSMENYIDFYAQDQDNFNRIGDLCTLLTATPIKNLTVSTGFAINAGGNFKDTDEFYGPDQHKGFSPDWLNRWSFNINYTIFDDVKLNLGYQYNRPYASRSAYSMGSTLTQYEAGSFFDKYYYSPTDQVTYGISFPLTPDRRTFFAYNGAYDILNQEWDSQTFQLIRNFHCWAVALEYSFNYDSATSTQSSNLQTSYGITFYLTGITSPITGDQNTMLNRADQNMRTPQSPDNTRITSMGGSTDQQNN